MFRYIMAFAATALLASQVQAATISGPTTVEAGIPYVYTYQPSEPNEILDVYDFYVLRLNVTDSTSPDVGYFAFTGGEGGLYDPTATYSFFWTFNTTGPVVLSVISWFDTFSGPGVALAYDEFGPFGRLLFEDGSGKAAASAFSERVALQISVVPIGGTLPLLVSALGLMGWAARRRAQKAALPA